MISTPNSTRTERKSRLFLVLAAGNLLMTTLSPAAEQPRMRTWTDASGKHRTQAALIEVYDVVKLLRADGQVITLEVRRLSEADREYLRAGGAPAWIGQPAPQQEPKEKPTIAPADPAAKPMVRETVATGVGIDANEAEQDAFRRAIEQTVGVLVWN